MDKFERLKKLTCELNKLAYEYYTLDNPSVSDKEYDEKYDELVKLEKETGVILPYSPTQRVGDVILEKFQKHQHKFKCYSMDKVQNYKELIEWDKKNKTFVIQNNLPPIQYVVMKKFDGLTINNTYDENGILIKAATRGTGEIGELVTPQVKTIKSVPLIINYNHLVEIHGEALMTKKEFLKYNESTQEPLKNLRNGAAGAIKNLNIKETAKRNLSSFFYDVGYNEGSPFKTYIEMMEFIERMGFQVDKEYYLCNTIEEVKEKIDLIEQLRPNLDYEIDGAIVSINDIYTREVMGYTTKFPKWAIAFKYEAEETTTTLLGIEWNTGRTGKATPKAKIEPVELMGVTVKQATLNSMNDITRKGIKIGADVFIRRSNDVIPEILGVVEESITDDMKNIEPPVTCPSCGSELVKDGVHYFCVNTLNCKPQIIKAIDHYGSREAMNIDGFSEQTAELLYANKIISTIADLYKLENHKDEIIKLPKFGLKKYNNLIESINNSKNVKLDQFIFALGIPGVGKGTSKDLAEHFKTIDKFVAALNIAYDLTIIKDIGDETKKEILSWWQLEGTRNLVYEILNYVKVLDFEDKKEVKVIDNPFKNKKIYCTGTFATYKKEQLKNIVESLGGEFTSGYSKSLDYLVVGSLKGSGKVDKALNDGVKVLQEDEFSTIIKEINT